jgi:hypothetical protein
LGTIGDFYLNTTTNTLFGPKTAGGWGSGVSLVGPAGPAGPAGPQGPAGSGGGTLDQAYDFGGPGLGRVITADAGPVQANLPNGNGTINSVAIRANVTGGQGVGILVDQQVPNNGFAAIEASSASTQANSSVILGTSTAAATAIAGTVNATATSQSAVWGNNLRTSGGYGVYGTGVQGVVGENNNNQTAAVFGQNNAAASGTALNRAPGVVGSGFYGTIGQTTRQTGIGVFGNNTAPGTVNDNPGVGGIGFTGVLGQSSAPGVGFGVLSADDIGAVGGIYGAFKAFRIDHPLDPENKYLNHFCPESNEMLNFYRGNVVLDANGEATVNLPDYFQSINVDYSYNLTAVGSPAPGLYVATEIDNNKFTIAGGKPGMKVSWQVTGVRNDAYILSHPEKRINEVPKQAEHRGLYIHPESFGKGQDKAIHKRIENQSLFELEKSINGQVNQLGK